MSATPAPAPTIKNPGRKPATPRKLFVNIPVANVQRSIDFFEGLGFTFNAQFTDASGTAMLVGEDAYCMLLTHEKFLSFSKRPLANPRQATGALFTLGVDSREAVVRGHPDAGRTLRWDLRRFARGEPFLAEEALRTHDMQHEDLPTVVAVEDAAGRLHQLPVA